MGYIKLTGLILSQPITGNIAVTIRYRLASVPNSGANYTTVGNAILKPDGDFTEPFIIENLLDGENYVVQAVPICGSANEIKFHIATTTTTSTSSTTTTTSTSTTSTTTISPTESVILWEFKNRNDAQGVMRLYSDGVTPDYVNTNQENTTGSFTVAAGTSIALKNTYETATSNGFMIQNLTDNVLVLQTSQDAAFWNQLLTTEGGKSYKITVLIDTQSIATDVTWTYSEYNGAQGEGRMFENGALILNQVMTNQASGSATTDHAYIMKARVDLLSGNQTRVMVKNITTGVELYDFITNVSQEFQWEILEWNRYQVILAVNDTTVATCTAFTSLQVWTFDGDPPTYDQFGQVQ